MWSAQCLILRVTYFWVRSMQRVKKQQNALAFTSSFQQKPVHHKICPSLACGHFRYLFVCMRIHCWLWAGNIGWLKLICLVGFCTVVSAPHQVLPLALLNTERGEGIFHICARERETPWKRNSQNCSYYGSKPFYRNCQIRSPLMEGNSHKDVSSTTSQKTNQLWILVVRLA